MVCSTCPNVPYVFSKLKLGYREWKREEVVRGIRGFAQLLEYVSEAYRSIDLQRTPAAVNLNGPEKWDQVGNVIGMTMRDEDGCQPLRIESRSSKVA